MKCPTCHVPLVREKYAGANVQDCPQCSGALLDTRRAEKIKRRVNKDLAQLTKEINETSSEDTKQEIRCPRCRAKMRKREIKQLQLFVDDCHQCDLSWFDGGELAALQLEFENDPQTVELNRMRKRLKEMTDEERAEYEANIAKLKDLGSPLGQAFRGATFQMARRRGWIFG